MGLLDEGNVPGLMGQELQKLVNLGSVVCLKGCSRLKGYNLAPTRFLPGRRGGSFGLIMAWSRRR